MPRKYTCHISTCAAKYGDISIIKGLISKQILARNYQTLLGRDLLSDPRIGSVDSVLTLHISIITNYCYLEFDISTCRLVNIEDISYDDRCN